MIDIQQEPEYVERSVIVFGAVAVVATILLSTLIIWRMLIEQQGRVRYDATSQAWERPVAEAGNVEASVFREGTQHEGDAQRARAQLSRYGYADAKKQRIHIPIATAIELYLEQHGGQK